MAKQTHTIHTPAENAKCMQREFEASSCCLRKHTMESMNKMQDILN